MMTFLLAMALANDGGVVIQAAGTDEKLAGQPAKLVGPDARLQLVVTAPDGKGGLLDVTGKCAYSTSPDGVVAVDAHGQVAPLKDGTATVKALAPNGGSSTVQIAVERFGAPDPINFANKVVPIFTKLGCNSGGCHGKSGGQNGFRLSLLGFEPQEDYEWLVQESFGRRLFPAAPDHSLLLLKGTGALPHGGGDRLKKDGHDYRLITRWILQGMPYGKPEDPFVSGVSVYPRHRVMTPDGLQQIKVVAHYNDGTSEDVTHAARYEPNEKLMAEVDEAGRVRMLGLPGEVAIMVRYQDRVAVFEATVPLGIAVKTLPPAKNVVDELVYKKLQVLGLPPSAVADDGTFLRRATLDLAGRLPTAVEAKAFLADKDPAKRDKAVDRLIASDDYADWFANKWTAILRNKRDKESYASGNYGFHGWLRDALRENMPYDRLVREILTASGEISRNPAVAWYRQVSKDFEQTEDVAQLFLGVRIQCARCHHHPFEKWSGNDYYGLAAFFSRVGRKDGLGMDEPRIFHKRGTAEAKHPKTGQPVKPAGLGEKPLEIAADEDPRTALADWMSRKDNPFFAKSLVNRYWKHFFGRGLVDPEDDMRETNPPSNKELLDALARRFIEKGFDLKDLVRTIAQSTTYQLTSLPNEHNGNDRQAFSRFYPRRLPAEVLLDAIDQFNGTTTAFPGMPAGARAVQIPDHGGVSSYFLTVFGKPQGASACECERSGDASLAQSLHLLNSQDIHGKVGSGIAKTLAADARPDPEKLDELYLRGFSRTPTEDERKIALAHLAKADAKAKAGAWEDVVWALINTKEFLFNH